MQDKILKAYRTAWRWPEVYSDAPSIIWTSRAIAFLVPLGLIALTIITGVPLFGWAASGFIAVFIAFVLILMTVRMFYEEFDTVENFQSRESRIKDFFTGFPAITPLPIIENEPNEWVAYGHVPPHDFIEAIQSIVLTVTEDAETADQFPKLENSVGHLYASFVNPAEGHWSEGIELCKKSSEDCFPITRLQV